MAHKPTFLFTTVTLYWLDRKGNEQDCTVEVDFTHDGSDIVILSDLVVGANADEIPGYDDMLHEAVSEQADEVYAEYMADYGEYLSDQAMDRRIMAPMMEAAE